jgi:hypothetical protein
MARDVLFSFAAMFVFVSLMLIIQLIGPNILGNLLIGRYYQPREEERIILSLDLAGSTGIAAAWQCFWAARCTVMSATR